MFSAFAVSLFSRAGRFLLVSFGRRDISPSGFCYGLVSICFSFSLDYDPCWVLGNCRSVVRISF